MRVASTKFAGETLPRWWRSDLAFRIRTNLMIFGMIVGMVVIAAGLIGLIVWGIESIAPQDQASAQSGTSVICTWENPRTEVRGDVIMAISDCRDAADKVVETRVNHIMTG